ncbi:hypothetical protein Fot_02919 [Forsythia ovata]|uniref:Uncharacterized protein n=1 Tax=Forsythia ovata TaxID=205694 RepID=A0ABD1X887_9LAMI
MLVMAEPIKAMCAISKMAFNANYFRLIRKMRIEQFTRVIILGNSDDEADGITLMMAKLTLEEAADLQMQKKEGSRQKKGKWVAGPSKVMNPCGGRISPRTHRVNLGLASDEEDRVEEWVEYIRELSEGHEDPESDPSYWACSKYPTELSMSNFTKVRNKYRIPEEIRLIFPSKADRPCDPVKEHIAPSSSAITLLSNTGGVNSSSLRKKCSPNDLVLEITIPRILSHRRSNTLPKIDLAGLAAKKIPPVVRKKEADKNQKKELASLSLKSSEQMSTPQTPNKPHLHHPCLPRIGPSSKHSSKDEEDLEVLEDESLIRRAKKSITASSKSLQNQPTGGARSLETHEVVEPQA